MRNLHLIDVYRMTGPEVVKLYGSIGDDTCGVFQFPSKTDHALLRCIASSGMGWEHVSVSRKNRTPNWPEMCQVKDVFFFDFETVVQYHVPPDDHINDHPNCLHLWRPIDKEIPRPPSFMVGGMTKEEADKAAEEYARTRKVPA